LDGSKTEKAMMPRAAVLVSLQCSCLQERLEWEGSFHRTRSPPLAVVRLARERTKVRERPRLDGTRTLVPSERPVENQPVLPGNPLRAIRRSPEPTRTEKR